MPRRRKRTVDELAAMATEAAARFVAGEPPKRVMTEDLAVALARIDAAVDAAIFDARDDDEPLMSLLAASKHWAAGLARRARVGELDAAFVDAVERLDAIERERVETWHARNGRASEKLRHLTKAGRAIRKLDRANAELALWLVENVDADRLAAAMLGWKKPR